MAKKKLERPEGGPNIRPGGTTTRKSAVERKKRFAKKAREKRAQVADDLKKQWDDWDRLNDDQKRLLPHLEPTKPRPDDGGQSHP